MGVEVVWVSSDEELADILTLHLQNLKKNLSDEEKEKEGYVTAEYDMALLRELHEIKPSVIAKDGSKVVGYIIVATKNFYGKHALLDDLYDTVDKIEYKNVPLGSSQYALCGQICVDKSYRGLGLTQKMYDFYRQGLKNEFQYCATSVALANPRSLKAHLNSGFEVIKTHGYENKGYHVILLDLRR
jgi:hypothetical protein